MSEIELKQIEVINITKSNRRWLIAGVVISVLSIIFRIACDDKAYSNYRDILIEHSNRFVDE